MVLLPSKVLKTLKKRLSKLKLNKKRLIKKFNKSKSSLLLILVGFSLFYFGIYNYYKVRVLSFSGSIENTQQIENKDIPTKITIPSIKIDVSIEPAEIKNGVWDISPNNATYLVTSSAPGSIGNTVIYGHNKKQIFANLPYLKIGERVIVKTSSGKEHEYEVYKKEFVNPNRIDLVSQTDNEELTLFTCWGIIDNQRVVIKAKPLKSN